MLVSFVLFERVGCARMGWEERTRYTEREHREKKEDNGRPCCMHRGRVEGTGCGNDGSKRSSNECSKKRNKRLNSRRVVIMRVRCTSDDAQLLHKEMLEYCCRCVDTYTPFQEAKV